MRSDISKPHEGVDGFYYEDYIVPNKPETPVGKLVSTEWWHEGVRFTLIYNFQAGGGRKITLFAFQKHTGFYEPRDGVVNFKRVEKNALRECEIQKTRTGRYAWMSVRQIVEPKADVV